MCNCYMQKFCNIIICTVHIFYLDPNNSRRRREGVVFFIIIFLFYNNYLFFIISLSVFSVITCSTLVMGIETFPRAEKSLLKFDMKHYFHSYSYSSIRVEKIALWNFCRKLHKERCTNRGAQAGEKSFGSQTIAHGSTHQHE